jgi:hypothetical protein
MLRFDSQRLLFEDVLTEKPQILCSDEGHAGIFSQENFCSGKISRNKFFGSLEQIRPFAATRASSVADDNAIEDYF